MASNGQRAARWLARNQGRDKSKKPRISDEEARIEALQALLGDVDPDSIRSIRWHDNQVMGETVNGTPFSIGF